MGEHSAALKLFLFVANIIAMIAVVVFGSIITAMITAINIVVLLGFMAVIYIGFSVIWIVDRVYLIRKKFLPHAMNVKRKV